MHDINNNIMTRYVSINDHLFNNTNNNNYTTKLDNDTNKHMDTSATANHDIVAIDIGDQVNNAAYDTSLVDEPTELTRQKSEKVTNVDYSQKRIMTVYIALFGAISISSLDTSIVGVAAPSISEAFGEFESFGWVSSAYLLTRSAFTPLYGRLSDMYGRRCMMMIAIAIFAVGSIISATATSMIMLITGRAVQGIGGAGLGSLVMTIVGDMVPPVDRGKYQGLLASAFGIFSIAGPVIGGGLIAGLSWRWLFWINLPICGVVGTIVFFLVKIPVQTPDKKLTDLDWWGSILICGATVCLILGLVWGGSSYPWISYQVLVPLLLAFPLIALFIYVEWRQGDNALIPLDMFSNRNYCLSMINIFLFGAVLFGLITYLPNYFQLVYGDSAAISGIRQVPLMVPFLLSNVGIGQLISRTGGKNYRWYPLVGAIIALIGSSILAPLFTNDLPYYAFALLLAVQGTGMGIISPVGNMLVSNSVPLNRLAVATVCGGFVRALGGSIGSAIAATLLNNSYRQQLALGLGADNVPAGALSYTYTTIKQFSPDVIAVYQSSYTYAMSIVFYSVIGMNVCMAIASPWFQQVALRGRNRRKPVVDDKTNDSTFNEQITSTTTQQHDSIQPVKQGISSPTDKCQSSDVST